MAKFKNSITINEFTRSCFYDKLDTTKRQCLLIKLTDEKGHVGLRLDLPVTVLISNYGFVFESLLLAIQGLDYRSEIRCNVQMLELY